MPVLTDETIEFLLAVAKPVSDPEWRETLLPVLTDSYTLSGRLDLDDLPSTGAVRGHLHLYSRQNLNPVVAGDWSVGLVYTDYANRSYRVLRCNGPHPTDHSNAMEKTIIVRTPHIHHLTERYQRLRPPRPDGFASETSDYTTIEEAVEVLAKLINLQPVGILFL